MSPACVNVMRLALFLSAAVLPATLAFASSCTPTTPPGAHPHDMSAAEHREQARAEDSKAAGHEGQYDPKGDEEHLTGSPQDSFTYELTTYNPTGKHLDQGAAHRDHASAHRQAARELERFEQSECAKFPPKTRAASPLIGQVASATNIEEGVRLTVAKGVNRDAMLAHMRCHAAYAATLGFKGMDTSPLFIQGVSIEAAGDDAITLMAQDPTSIAELQKRTAAHVK